MARRRSKIKAAGFSIANKLFPFIKAATPIVAFLEQITSKDRQTLGATFSTATTTVQLKIITNIVLGRLAGIKVFNSTTDPVTGAVTILPSAPQTLNPAGILNKWTNAGLIGIGYGIFGKAINNMSSGMGLGNVIPAVSKIKSIGKGALIGGAVGGFFDAPAGNGTQTTTESFPSLQSTPTLQRQVLTVTNSSTTIDSTESGMT